MANQPTKYSKFLVGAASAALVATAVAPVASAAEFSDVKGNTHEAGINALSAAGVITGYQDGTFKPNKTLTRNDVVKLLGKWLVNSKGYKVPTDYKTNPRFKDQTSSTNDELLKYSAVVKDNGVFNGKENGTLAATEDITRENMALVLVRAYDTVNKTDLVKFVAEQKDFKKDVTDLAKAKAEARPYIDVLDYFDITNPVAPEFRPKETTTRGQFATFLNKTSEVKVTPVVTTATKVASVTATNLVEVEVKFDGTVDQASAENKDNYTLATGTVDYAELLEDGKTVRLTLTAKIQNQVANKLTVTNVKAGDKVVSVTDFAFTPIDNTLPTVLEVKNLGTKAVKVVFSEPVATAVAGNFVIDGKPFYGSVTEGSREVILTPYDSATLSVGEHTLTVTGVSDYFGLKALSSEHKFTVVEDKVAPTVTGVDATLEKAVVTFSEDVDPSTVSASNVYWKQGDTKKYANGTVKKLASDKYEFSFTNNPLPAFETTLYVEGVKDYSGNTITETTVKVTAKVDQVRPEVTEVKADSANAKNITVKFSKPVTAADKKYFTVLDEDGKVQTISEVKPADGSNQVFTVVLYNDLAQGKNTIKIAGVKDKTTLENTMMDYQTVIGVKDNTPPTISGNASASNSSRSVIITFSEEMDLASIANKANYLMNWSADGVTAATLRQLPEGTQLTPVQNGKAVLVTFPEKLGNVSINFPEASASILGTVKGIQVMGVKDVSGNILASYSVYNPISVVPATLAAYSSTVAKNAVLTEKNTVKVKFDQAIGTASATDFTSSLGVIQSATANGTDVVTLKFASNVGTTIADNTISVVANNNMKTVNGNKVVPAGAAFTIADQVKPEVAVPATQTTLNSTGNTIHLPFSEALTANGTQIALFASDLTVTNLSTGKAVTLDRITTTRNADTKTIDIAIAPLAGETGEYSVKVNNVVNYIQDTAGNKAVESATYETARGAVDGVNPFLSSVELTTDATTIGSFGDVGDALTLTFNENIKLALTDNVGVAGVYAMDNTEFTAVTGLTAADGAFTAEVTGNKVVIKVVTTPISTKIVANNTVNALGTATVKLKDIAGNSLVATTGVKLVDRVAPLTVTGPTTKMLTATTFQVTFNEAVNATAADFTNFMYDADAAGANPAVPVAVVSVAGTGTNTITVTTAANATFATGVGTATVNIGAGVKDLAGNSITPVVQVIATN